MENLVFTQLSVPEIKSMIRDCFKEVLQENIDKKVINPDAKSNLVDINWYCEVNHKAKPSVYSDISNGKIPKCLIHKPKGAKKVLFYKERVLNWIELGCPSEFKYNEKKGGIYE
jgi:hypothetical protein